MINNMSLHRLDVKQEKLLAAVEPLIADARKLAKSPPVQRKSPFPSRLAENKSPGKSNSPLSFSGGRRTPPTVPIAAEPVVESTPQGVNGYFIEMDGKKLFIQEDAEEDPVSEEDADEEDAPAVDSPDQNEGEEEEDSWDVEVSLDASRGMGVQLQEFNEYTRIVNIDSNGQASLGKFLLAEVAMIPSSYSLDVGTVVRRQDIVNFELYSWSQERGSNQNGERHKYEGEAIERSHERV